MIMVIVMMVVEMVVVLMVVVIVMIMVVMLMVMVVTLRKFILNTDFFTSNLNKTQHRTNRSQRQ